MARIWDDDVLTVKAHDSGVLASAEPDAWSWTSHPDRWPLSVLVPLERVGPRELDEQLRECIGPHSKLLSDAHPGAPLFTSLADETRRPSREPNEDQRTRVNAMADMWATISSERGALAEDLADLSSTQWETPSLCAEWTVQEALAHMTSTAHISPPSFLLGLAGSGFNFEKFSRTGIERWRGDRPAQTLQNFREVQQSRKHPPGPSTTWLGEAIVHAEDIRRPLGIAHTYPADAVRQVLDFYKGSNAIIGTKRRIDGVTLRATDTDWTHGSGPEVQGPLLSLLLAGTGRKAVLDDLTGNGVTVLRARP